MTRKHALTLIANQLVFILGEFAGFDLNPAETDMTSADVILTTLEAAGMLPPEHTIIVKGGFSQHVQTWEPET